MTADIFARVDNLLDISLDRIWDIPNACLLTTSMDLDPVDDAYESIVMRRGTLRLRREQGGREQLLPLRNAPFRVRTEFLRRIEEFLSLVQKEADALESDMKALESQLLGGSDV